MTTVTLQAIIERPDDDGLRLMYADWLEEGAGTVRCRRCDGSPEGAGQLRWHSGSVKTPTTGVVPCPDCSGTGRIPDGRRERAEFIRVQCELWVRDRTPFPPGVTCTCTKTDEDFRNYQKGVHCHACVQRNTPIDALRRRERELLRDHWAQLLEPRPAGSFVWRHDDRIGWGFKRSGEPSHDVEGRFRRGFVEVVTLSAADWLAHGPALLRVAPIREVRLTDREPLDSPAGRGVRWVCEESWPWRNRPRPPDTPSTLPRILFDRLKGRAPGHWHYDTADLAYADLSRACLAWARLPGDARTPDAHARSARHDVEG